MWEKLLRPLLSTIFPEHVKFVETVIAENDALRHENMELRRRDQKNTALLTSRAVFFHTWDEATPKNNMTIIVCRSHDLLCVGVLYKDTLKALLQSEEYTHWAHIPPDLLG
jgi:hypothetical protein